MPYCSKCGAQNPETAKFCSNCGAPLQSVAEAIQPSAVPSTGVGAKVSFKASDEKTYTGTIEEIKGDQYRVKYDAFDFETWLKREQFAYIASGANTAAYATTPATGETIPPPRSTTPAFFTHLGFWGSVMIIIGFFTDWINLFGYGGITGLRILTSLNQVGGSEQDQDHFFVAMEIAIIIIVASALICLAHTLGIRIARGAFAFFKILPLLTIIAFIVYVIVKMQQYGQYQNDELNGSAWQILGVGIYLTLAGSLLLAISRNRK